MNEKIVICVVDHDGCWIWQGCRTTAGYPIVRQSNPRRLRLLTRVILESKLGRPLRPLMQALHKCDKPSCVNPECLWEGDQSSNLIDMVQKQRNNHRRGERSPRAKLTEANVREILNGKESNSKTARRFNVALATIQNIRTRKTWRHLNESQNRELR